MGRLVVIEGVDGAGKRTLADALSGAVAAQGGTVARLAFPRYGADVHADLARDALYGRLGDTTGSVHAMALLFALDRRGAREELVELRAGHDLLLLDRYVASNAAYGAARRHEGPDGPFAEWVRELEIDRFGLPVPDGQLLLRVPVALAATRAEGRAGTEADRARDGYETDGGLQARCAAVYDGLAAAGWLTPWTVLDGSATAPDLAGLAARLLAAA